MTRCYWAAWWAGYWHHLLPLWHSHPLILIGGHL